MLSALTFGGFDTTASTALASLIWLDSNRAEHERLIDDQSYLRNAVEELLRVFTPSPGVTRNATCDAQIGGRTVRKGERVYCWNAGANRDPSKFEDPERVELGRANASHHLAYSGGRHRCLGASLGSLELQITLRTILERFPHYRIDHANVVRYPSFASIHGFKSVPATLNRKEPS
jgi:cytochrome P450